jgi:hypothetical protein
MNNIEENSDGAKISSEVIKAYLGNAPWMQEAQAILESSQTPIGLPSSLLRTIQQLQGAVVPNFSPIVELSASIQSVMVPPIDWAIPTIDWGMANLLNNINWFTFDDKEDPDFEGAELFYDKEALTDQTTEEAFLEKIAFLMSVLQNHSLFAESPLFALMALSIKHLNQGDYISSTTLLKDVFLASKEMLPNKYTLLWYPGTRDNRPIFWQNPSIYLERIDEVMKESDEWSDSFSRYLARFLVPAFVSTSLEEIPDNFAQVDTRHRSAHGVFTLEQMDQVFSKNNSWFYLHYSLVMLTLLLRENNQEDFSALVKGYCIV